MNNLIRLSRSDVGDNEILGLSNVINDGYLGMGSYVDRLESQLKAYLQTKSHVICVSSGTAALHLALQASGVGYGDEVLVPSITYLASYQAISACGALPVSCDVQSDTLFLDTSDAEQRITSRTKAILAVHYASSNAGIDKIYSLASAYGLSVIEDAAHSFGSSHRGFLVGASESLVCFSFDGIKNITCGEGGAVVTSSDRLADYIRDARLLGVSNDSARRIINQRSWQPDVLIQGWRYHMSNLCAAIGTSQLSSCDFKFNRRRELAQAYILQLISNSSIQLLDLDYSSIVPHIFPIIVRQSIRDTVRARLDQLNIQTGIHYYPNHLLSKYRSSYSLPVAENAGLSLISLPLHTLLTESEHSFVIDSLVSILSHVS